MGKELELSLLRLVNEDALIDVCVSGYGCIGQKEQYRENGINHNIKSVVGVLTLFTSSHVDEVEGENDDKKPSKVIECSLEMRKHAAEQGCT